MTQPIDFIETAATKEKTTTVSSTTIPLTKEQIIELPLVSIDKDNIEFWSQKSQKLVSEYMYGVSLGVYGINSNIIDNALDRTINTLILTIKNICSNENKSSEDLTCHFNILSSIIKIIAKDLKNKDLKDTNAIDMLATLHGFIVSFIKQIG